MRGNLIPVIESDAPLFAMKNSINPSGEYTNEDICTYKDDMYACSLYEFTITNNANVTQDMMVTLTPYPNGFGNLHYMIYESKQLELNTDRSVVKTATHIDKVESSVMIDSVVLKPGQSKTYTVVFYVKSMDYDQTSEDAGKRFGAIIRVDSTTTKASTSVVVGETCYEMDELDDGTFKLTSFNGIDENGNVDTTCGVTKSKDGFYSIIIPSKIGESKISTLGANLFARADLTFQINKYSKIENVTIEEEITTIEDGSLTTGGTFFGMGLESISFDEYGVVSSITHYDRPITVTFPSTLTKIGSLAFIGSGVKNVIFNLDKNNSSNLETIGESAFQLSNLSSIKIPSSVQTIGNEVFLQNINLTSLTFEGASDGTSRLTVIGDNAFKGCNITTGKDNPLLIPYSVTSIGTNAFYSNFNLTKLEFAGSHTDVIDDINNPDYNLLTIGEKAFYGDGLDYSGEEELVLPARVSFIYEWAFQGNPDDPIYDSLKNIKYMGDFDLGTAWYNTGIITVRDKNGNVIQS